MRFGDIHPNTRVVHSSDGWVQRVVVHVYRRDIDGCPMAVCAWLDNFGQLQGADHPIEHLRRAEPDADDDAVVNEHFHTA